MVKNLPAVQEPQETQVSSPGLEGPLEEGMVIHSSILAWRIPWREEPGGLQSKWMQIVNLWQLGTHTHKNKISLKAKSC